MMTEQEFQEVEEIFLKFLEKESGYYHVILDLTCTEGERLEKGKPFEEIQNLLRKKKIILSCIEEIEISLAPLKKYWMQNKARSSQRAQQIQAQIVALSVLVKEILQQDLENQQRLKHYLTVVKSQK